MASPTFTAGTGPVMSDDSSSQSDMSNASEKTLDDLLGR